MTQTTVGPSPIGRVRATRYPKLVFDLDGTLYRGQETTPHAVEVVNGLRATAELFFLSNNSSLPRWAMAERLRTLGFDASLDEALSSADLVADYLSRRERHAAFFPVCSRSLEDALVSLGHRSAPPDEARYVIVGVDLELTYAKLSGGLTALRRGASFIAANLDRVFPAERELRQGAGAIVGAFQGMGFEPDVICGKPDAAAIERAFELRGLTKGEGLLMIGDQLETDILGAQRVGVDSVLVLTGASTEADIESTGIRPTYVIENLSGLGALLHVEPTR